METSRILNLTANLIEHLGWTQGTHGWGNKKLCLEGGLLAAMGLDFYSVELEDFWSCPAYRAVMQYLDRDETRVKPEHLEHPFPAEPLWSWNDESQRTQEEVIAVLRAAALIEAAKGSADVREPVTV